WPVGGGERVEIAPLRRAALREAITRPAAVAGVHLEPVLVERLLQDAGEEPGALSLLQETMVLLWERRTRRLLTVSAYEDLGGPDGSGLAAAPAGSGQRRHRRRPPARRPGTRRLSRVQQRKQPRRGRAADRQRPGVDRDPGPLRRRRQDRRPAGKLERGPCAWPGDHRRRLP